MTCHHCAANAQKAIASVKGVTKATVSLDEGMAYVEGDFNAEDIRKAVESIGFEMEKCRKIHIYHAYKAKNTHITLAE